MERKRLLKHHEDVSQAELICAKAFEEMKAAGVEPASAAILFFHHCVVRPSISMNYVDQLHLLKFISDFVEEAQEALKEYPVS